MKHKFIAIVTTVLIFLGNFNLVYAIELTISGNGANSESQINLAQENNQTISQSNSSTVTNDIVTDANTGNNSANENQSENVNIDTGNVSQTANITNSLNTSIVDDSCCASELDVNIQGNADFTQNAVNVNSTNNNNVVVNQNVVIKNNINSNANTGHNIASKNTGDVKIQTGSISSNVSVKNLSINQSHIDTSKASAGSVNIKIADNASNSQNIVGLNINSNTSVYIVNTANISNDVLVDVNTGFNTADKNSGDVSIITGDIDVLIDIANEGINFSSADVNSCCVIEDPSDPGDPGDPGDPDDPSDPGIGGWEYSDPGSNSSSPPNATANAIAGAVEEVKILGLSATSSEEANSLLFFAGLIMMVVGARLISETKTHA